MSERSDPPFAWHFESTEVGGRRIELAVASDPDAMLIDACERQDAGEQGVIDPFWAATWRAAAGLDRYLGRLDLTGTRVLELGCGTGHAGIAAAIRGASVTLTDGVEEPLQLVRHSVRRLGEIPGQIERVERLRFGRDRLDLPPWPIVIGSDVTYLRQLWPDLERCAGHHLDDGGTWLLSDPYRIIANEFVQWIGNHGGWSYREHRIALEDDPDHPIRVMEFTRSP